MRLVNEARPAEPAAATSRSKIVPKPRPVRIKKQIRTERARAKVRRSDRCCNYCCFKNPRAASWPSYYMGRKSQQTTCTTCRCMIQTELVYEVRPIVAFNL